MDYVALTSSDNTILLADIIEGNVLEQFEITHALTQLTFESAANQSDNEDSSSMEQEHLTQSQICFHKHS